MLFTYFLSQIFIGGWSNSKSAIRRDRAKPDKAVVDTEGILSADEHRGFWINYLGGAIAVGKENEVTVTIITTSHIKKNVVFSFYKSN